MTDLGSPRVPRGERIAVEAGRITDGPTAPDLLLILKRQKWPLVLGAVIGLLVGLVHYATSPARYYAASVVLIDERAIDPGQEFGTSFPLLRNETAALNEMQVLRSLELAKTVTRQLGLHENPDFMDEPVSLARHALSGIKAATAPFFGASQPTGQSQPTEEARVLVTAARLQRDVGLTRIGRSFSIEISMLHHDSQIAAEIANAYARAYLAESRVASRQAAEEGADWLRRNIEEVRRSADEAAREAAEFRTINRAIDPQGLQTLDQRVETLNEIHGRLLERLEMVTIEGSYPITNGRLLSQALPPRDPALPKAWRLLAGGLVLGLLFGTIIAVWRELSETGLRTGEDVRQAAGVPFLGYLPRFSERRLRRLKPLVVQQSLPEELPKVAFSRARMASSDGGHNSETVNLTRHFAPLLYLPSIAPDLPYNDGLKGLLVRVARMNSSEGGCVAAIASLNSGEGRTTLAANIAQFAALGGLNTLLIDADMSNPALSRELGFSAEVGLSEVLAGRASLSEAVTELPATGLEVLPYVPPPSPTAQAGIMKLSVLLSEARDAYDLVVLDTQPMGTSTDVTALLSAIDAVVMVADWGRTEQAALRAAFADDTELTRKTAGIVLNRTVMRRLSAYGAGYDRLSRSARQTYS